MYASRVAALTRQTKEYKAEDRRRNRNRSRRNGGAGPVHRAGPMSHDAILWDVEDPAAHLMAPATEFYARARRVARSGFLLAASFSMTPALPALFGAA